MISWAPALNWPRMFVMGNTGDTMAFVFNDPDVPAAGNVAGDIRLLAEFWMYDLDQVTKYPVNTAQPVICF